MLIEYSTDIAASPERIWSVMSDVARWPEWTPTVTRAEMLDTGALRVGARFRIQQPRLPRAIWTVTAVEPGRRFTWRNRAPGLTSIGDHLIEPRGTSSMSRVTLVLEWTGWMTPVIRLLYGSLSQRYVRTEGESLKQRCEAAGR